MDNYDGLDQELYDDDYSYSSDKERPIYGLPAARIYSLDELLQMDLPPIEWLLYPFIPIKGVCMIAAPRGIGKSFLAMTMAIAVSSGISFLGFKAEKRYRVLYMDGEMNGRTLQDRFNALIAGFEQNGQSVNTENLHIYGCDFQNDATMPDIANPRHWPSLDNAIRDIGNVDLIILDNIYTLYNCPDENAASNWQAFNKWSVLQRAEGRSVLWIHHTGKDADKGGRGSSAIETILDASILLKRPQGYATNQGAIISVEYTKCRSIAGNEVSKFTMKLSNSDTGLIWTLTQGEEEQEIVEFVEMLNSGMDVNQIAEETGVSKSRIYAILKSAGISKPAAIAKAAQQQLTEENKKLIQIPVL